MGNVRVYELAKEMGLENKELLTKLAEAGLEVKSHASSLTDEDLQKFKSFGTPTEEKMPLMIRTVLSRFKYCEN